MRMVFFQFDPGLNFQFDAERMVILQFDPGLIFSLMRMVTFQFDPDNNLMWMINSVADSDLGSDAFLTPGSGIRGMDKKSRSGTFQIIFPRA